MGGPLLVAEFETFADYLAAHEAEVVAGGLFVRGAVLPEGARTSDCTLRVRIAGQDAAELPATVGSVALGAGVAVIFLQEPTALLALAAGGGAPEAADEEAELEDRSMDQLSLPERIKLALTCGREERIALLRGPHRQLQLHVLKNPRITVDEVQWAARLPTLAPDALKLISEQPEWSQNASVASALVKNPRTPLPLALRLLPRLAASEIRSIAKGNGRPPIVQAARKMVIS